MGIAHSILDLIGNTPLLALERYVPGGRVLAKLESFNPCPRPRTGPPST